MSFKPQKKVYESIDIISEEMARQMVQENKHKLSNNDGSEFFEINLQSGDKNLNNNSRSNKKKWTITKNIIFNKLKEKSSKKNFDSMKFDDISEENEEKEGKTNNPLYNIPVSSIKSHERKNEKFSSFKKNNNNSTIKNKNIEEEKSQKAKEKNILILHSEGTSNSPSSKSNEKEKEEENENKKENENEKENKNNTDNINNENKKEKEKENVENTEKNKINEIANKEITKNVIKNPTRRRSVEPKMKFPLRKTKTTAADLDSYSSANLSKSNDSEKKEEDNSSKKLNKKLNPNKFVKDFNFNNNDKFSSKRKVRFKTNFPKNSQKMEFDSNDLIITPFSSEDDLNFSEEKKPKTVIKLHKTSLKNMTIYRPKFSAKQFYEHEIFLQKRKERINNSKKIKQQEKENENNKSIPTINPLSNEYMLQRNISYIPIERRAIEYRNQRNFRTILNERLKEKEIEEMRKQNKTINLDKNEVDFVYWRQQFWKKKVEEKLNKSSYKKQKIQNEQEENKFKNYKLQLCSYSKKILEQKTKYFRTIDTNISVFERLYQDSKTHEKKMKNISRSYFNNFFKPNINHSFTLPKRNIYNSKSIQYYNTTNKHNKKNKKNNILKKSKKKKFSLTFEDINIQKSKSRNKKSKNDILTSIDSTKTSKNKSITLKQKVSFDLDSIKSIKSKMIHAKSKEISPIPIKLGEIKEADSILSESSIKHKRTQQNNKTIKVTDSSINSTGKNVNMNQLTNKDKDFPKEKTENTNIKDISLSSDKIDGITSNNVNNSNNSPKLRKSSSSVKQNSYKNINSNYINNSKEIKQEESFNQKSNEINNNNSPSFNSMAKKEQRENFDIDKSQTKSKIKSNNNSENLLEESHSFGKYNYSNFISKDNISKESKEKDPNKRQKSSKIKITNKKKEISKENNNKEEMPKNNFKKQITNFNFNPYDIEKENEKSNDTSSSEESSSGKKDEDDDNNLLRKIRNIEMKEERKKIDRIIEGKKNKKNIEEEKNQNELYMLNWRNNVANAIHEPFCYRDTKGIFYKFFKKN